MDCCPAVSHASGKPAASRTSGLSDAAPSAALSPTACDLDLKKRVITFSKFPAGVCKTPVESSFTSAPFSPPNDHQKIFFLN